MLQKWLVENRYSDSVVRRSAAMAGKIAVEGLLFGSVAGIFALVVSAGVNAFGFSFPEPLSLPTLWIPMLAGTFRLGWCYTNDTR